MKLSVVGIIPARMSSSRFPGKPLVPILGMPMVGHCYHRTRLALGHAATFVATCDEAIADYINSVGGQAVMTSAEHDRATTRTAEALINIEKLFSKKIEAVIIIQGDEPLVTPEIITEVVTSLNDKNINIVNVMSQIDSSETFENKNNVKVVVDSMSNALYFSRQPIPSPWNGREGVARYLQTGVMAFRREALLSFVNLEETPLEREESIDLNRILETGGKVQMIPTKTLFIGVDTEDDLVNAENALLCDPHLGRYHSCEIIR